MKTPSEVPFPPDLNASHGQAWKLERDDASAVVSSYIVFAPWAHPLWSFYVVSMITLSDKPGVEPAILNEPGMTHEICVMAVDPTWQMTTKKELPRYLLPINFAAQMKYDSDEDADTRLELAVQEIIEGKLNPDTDAISQWVSRFGGNCLIK